MRSLFVSEQRYIRNVLLQHRHIDADAVSFGKVLLEYYPPSRRPARHRFKFNCDFMLQFDERLDNCKSCCTSILPNTLGADVFVTFDEVTSRPLRTELLGGDAFSIEYYRDYIEQVEVCLSRLSYPVSIRQCRYVRIFVIENDICFLAFPHDDAPVMKGRTRALSSDDSASSITCSLDGSRLVYIDGWLRTSVAYSDEKLLAIDVGTDRDR